MGPKCKCSFASLIIAVMLLATTGCASKSPEEKTAELRSFYSARLNGFLVEEKPIMPELPELEAESAAPRVEEAAVSQAAEEGEEPAVAEVPVKQTVNLDILIQHRSYEKLPGLTVDISMADAAGQEKGHWRVWFDTSKLPKATVTQFTHILEDVGYEEGDGFFAEVRHPVPATERSEYREFSPSA